MHTPVSPLRAVAVRADRAMLVVLWLLVLASAGLAGWYNTWYLLVRAALPIALIPTLLFFAYPGSLATRCANAVAIMLHGGIAYRARRGLDGTAFWYFRLPCPAGTVS